MVSLGVVLAVVVEPTRGHQSGAQHEAQTIALGMVVPERGMEGERGAGGAGGKAVMKAVKGKGGGQWGRPAAPTLW